MKNYEERTCRICGETFKPWSNSQACCSKECMEINTKILKHKQLERLKAEKAMQKKRTPTKSKKQQQKEWAEVLRKCEAAGLSYGEAVAKGVI